MGSNRLTESLDVVCCPNAWETPFAKACGEAGLTVLFCGTPGIGKAMAAKALAVALDQPAHRVDLAQVINKYIGETEKTLKHLFDTAAISDFILSFDEADALFGKWTEVNDAHDRYTNVQVSYLLGEGIRTPDPCAQDRFRWAARTP